MGVIDRTLASLVVAARQRLIGPDPMPPPIDATYPGAVPTNATPVADIVDNPNVLAQANRGLFGELLYSTSALYNAVTGIGTSRDNAYFNQWATARPLRRSELYGMGRNALINQALAKLPNTATREGWRVEITDTTIEERGKVSDEIAAYEARLGIGRHVARALAKGRQYGEAMVVLAIDDGRPMSEPVDVANIRTIKWAAPIDVRYYQPATLYQADNEGFGSVETFRITDINGFLEDGLRYGPNSLSFMISSLDVERGRQGNTAEIIVHADRVLHFPTTDYLPLLETLQDSFGAFFESMNGIRTAARESSTVVYRVSSWLRKMWSENAGLAQQHMRTVDATKSSMNAWVLDKDNEDVEVTSRSLGGVAELANPFMVWLGAALGMPQTILFGVSPGGFGKGEAERETWHEEARAYFKDAIAPQLYPLHGYILAAQDGPGLPYDTQREIHINDLSPPDEETRSKLRSDALSDLRQLVKDDLISRAEARPAVAALTDDYFRPEIDLDAADDAPLAPVGVFTGAVTLMQALYPAGIPISAGRELMLALASTYFTPENVARVFPETSPVVVPPGTATAGDLPPTEDEPDTNAAAAEPSEVDVAWSTTPLPTDAMEAAAIAAEFGIPTVRVTRAHRAGLIEGWNVLGGKPRYSLAEVKRVVLQGNGKLAPSTDHAPHSLCIVLRLPPALARFVPWKAEDPSPPHVTLVYIDEVDPAHIDALLAELHETALDLEPIAVTHSGEVDYFDRPEKPTAQRVAFAATELADSQALFNELAEAVESLGHTVQVHGDRYVPHVTLAYLPTIAETYVGSVPKGTWTASEIEVWYAGETYPLALHGDYSDDVGRATDRSVDTEVQVGWIWRTQRDSRVRPEHRRLEGRRFKFGEVPPEGEPGAGYNCRCAKEIIVPPGSTKRAQLAAKRTVRRALLRRYKQVTGEALRRQQQAAARANDVDDTTCDGFFARGSDPKVYTKPDLRDRLRSKILRESRGGDPGEWSARKAQLLALEYKRAGGGYRDGAEPYEAEDLLAAIDYVDSLDASEAQQSLRKWTREEWMTCLPSGPSKEPAGSKRRYLPKRACEELSEREREATNRKKAEGARKGEQFVANTEAAAKARRSATDSGHAAEPDPDDTDEIDVDDLAATLAFVSGYDGCDSFDDEACVAELRDLSEEAAEKRIAEAFRKYHATVNMGAAELREWAKSPWSKKASVSRAPIDRNLRLLETPREKWTLAHAASALRTVNFVSRMRGAEQGEPVKIKGREGPSRRDISLKNWAYDPSK